MQRDRILVLRGGPSAEYDISMKTGSSVLKALNEFGYHTRDIIITKSSDWMEDGVIKSLDKLLIGTDVVFICLHGAYGEDGQLQKSIQHYGVPFTGSRSIPSSAAFNKPTTKKLLQRHGLVLPEHCLISANDFPYLDRIVSEIYASFGPEYLVKPVASGSSIGATFVRAGESLLAVLNHLLLQYDDLMVEEYIRGKEATVAVLDDYRGESTYTFPAIEIIPPTNSDFFDEKAKSSSSTRKICPGNFTYSEKVKLADTAALVHNALGLDQYSRADFIIRGGEVYFIEVNTLPSLTIDALYPQATASVGLYYNDLIDKLVQTAKL